jgi:hypothetical protein
MESASRPECGGNPKAIMALFILSIVGLLATAALIWCLTGFSRALKEKPKVIGLLLRVEINDAHMGQHKAMVIAFPGHLPQQTGTARGPKVPFREPAHCCLDRDFACFPSGETQFVNDGITNTNLEFRDSASGVRRTFRNASARLLTQSSNQTLTEKPPGWGVGRGWNVREIRMKGWI